MRRGRVFEDWFVPLTILVGSVVMIGSAIWMLTNDDPELRQLREIATEARDGIH